MGFFSKIRKRIKKIIPKEIRPFVPYMAAMIPGAGAAMGLGNLAPWMQKAIISGAARGLSDDQADLKDIGITAALAAGPDALGQFAGPTGPDQNTMMGMLRGGARTLADAGPLKTLATQGAIDYGIKAAELNEDALDKYNRELEEQGIRDKAARRSAIRAIYENTGTWDMDEVDEMLNTYGYRTGGRVRYAAGDMVTPDSEAVISELPIAQQNQIEGSQMAEEAYQQIFQKFIDRFPGLATGEETLEEMVAMLQAEEVMETPGLGLLGLDSAMDMITPESARTSAQAISRHHLSEGGMPWEKRSSYKFDKKKKKKGKKVFDKKKKKWVFDEEGSYEDFTDSIEAAKEGYDKLEELNTIKPLPIRELRLARGGDVDDEVMEFDEEVITPDYLIKEEGVEIGEQVSDPSRMDELNSLSMDLFGKPLGELDEIQMEMLMNFASQQALKPGLIDEYRNYKYQMEEQGLTPMPPRDYFRNEFGAARMGVAKGGEVDDSILEVMDEEVITPYDLKMEEGVEIGPMAGGGDRGWRAQMLAEELAEEQYGKEFYDLSHDQQMEIYTIALDMIDTGGMKKGGPVKKPRVKSIGVGKAKDWPGIKKIIEMNKKGRKRYADGGLMSLGGNEMDLRGGGFVPLGAKERADDVPARLSKNEFVMTADAVRGAGNGSVQKGADLMYNTMKQLEARG
tara:strand:+ start:4346 stop:6391 length:2046 start_codon:yes stop_codon:yes gene_type:complete